MAALIASVTDDEHEDAARLVLRAFSSSLFHQRIFAKVDSATHVQFLAVQARSPLQDPRCKMVKATRDGKMVGFARWTTPKDADTHAEQKAGNATSIWSQDGHYPPGSEINLAKELLEVPEKELLEPHFRIDMLAVDSGVQGARVGSTLLRHVCRQADDLGVAVYLRASPEALSLYRRFGFRQHGEPHRAASDPKLALYPMLRKPLELVPATVRDLAVLAPIHRRAFAPMPVTRYLCTSVDPAVLEESYQCHRAKVIEDAQGQYRGNSVMTVARQGDQVLGFVWSVRQPAAKDWPPVTSTQQEYPIPAGYVPVRKRDFDAMLMRHARVSLSCVGPC